MKAETILRNARARIAKEENWVRGSFYAAGKGSTGMAYPKHNPDETLADAKCFCSIGAVAAELGVPRANTQVNLGGAILEDWVREISGKDMMKAINYLKLAVRSLGWDGSIWGYNDAREHSHADVLAMFDLAIKRARRRHPNGG